MAAFVKSNMKGRFLEVRIPSVGMRGKEVYLMVPQKSSGDGWLAFSETDKLH